jgi:hypothetical protein
MTEAVRPLDRRADRDGYNPFPADVLAEVRRTIREAPEIGAEHFDVAYDAAILMLVGDGGLDVMFEPLMGLAGVSRRRAAAIAEGVWRCAEPSRSWAPTRG